MILDEEYRHWRDVAATYKRERDEACLALAEAREVLQAIVDVDPVDAILDPTRPLRIAAAALGTDSVR